MSALSYIYNTPTKTYTIDQFIACQSDSTMDYHNFSFKDAIEYKYMNEVIHYSTYNIVSDYLDEIRELCLSVELSDEEMNKYIYRPKLLAYDIYENPELGFMILLINDMCSNKQFSKRKLLLPTKVNMKTICQQLYNSNRDALNRYNSALN